MRYGDLMETLRMEEAAKGGKAIPVRAWPTWGGIRLSEAEYIVGSPEILSLMRRAEWVRPVVEANRLTIFDRGQLQKAWERFVDLGLEILKAEAARKTRRRCATSERKRDVSSSGGAGPSSR